MRVKIGNFSAWIAIDGEEQPLHSIEYSPDGAVATCWIASEAGKNFVAFWQDSLRAYSTAGWVYVDGQTGNDDDDYYQKSLSQDLGEIKVVIRRCEVVGRSMMPTYLKNYAEPDKVHERAKKAMGHRCKLGPEVSCQNQGMLETRNYEHMLNERVAQLQANGIVSQDNKAQDNKRKRAPTPDDVIDLCSDEPPAAKRKQGNGSKVKEEPGTTKVKTEKPDKQRPPRQLGDVIDLT
ncbi:hypothetical protein H0H92_014296 [Tricholoma furcatifolium]|nr:hypothetical protein H0H92_014296 [Tricholoma furcatifolium]